VRGGAVSSTVHAVASMQHAFVRTAAPAVDRPLARALLNVAPMHTSRALAVVLALALPACTTPPATPTDAGRGDDSALPDGATAPDGSAPFGDGGPAVDASARADTGPRSTASTLAHARDPIALDGAQLGALADGSHAPDRIAAYRYDDGSFVEVAAQVDEREVRAFADALSPSDHRRDATAGWSTSFYTGSNTDVGLTFVGDDHDATFDADDELVVMAADFGGAAPVDAAPEGVDATTRVELHATDAYDASREGYLYLFARSGSAPSRPSAVDLDVQFDGESGAFTSFFDSDTSAARGAPPRLCGDGQGWGVVLPEDTTITAASYTRHFAGRWLEDAMTVRGSAGFGPDLLDIHEARPIWAAFTGTSAMTTATVDTTSNRTCTHSVTSFSGAAGTLVTLRSGSVRAIRSYYGSNSGTINQRTHFYYPEREDVASFIRVHPIPGISDGLDLSTAALGMRYFNEHNTAGLDIDGSPDTFDRTFARWEMVTGATQGTILSVHHGARIELGADTASYLPEMFFIDDTGDLTCVCSGDDVMIGAHGFRVRAELVGLPNTDPRLPTPGVLTGIRTIYTLSGETDVATASAMSTDADALRVSIDGGAAIDPAAVACGDSVCEHDETNVNCAADCPAPEGADVCGDGTCGGYEAFVCLDDCTTPHQAYFECASASCATDYVPCVGDPSCQDALTALSMCTAAYDTCIADIQPTITDSFAASMFRALTTGCGRRTCRTEF
jgi:hypothetical protein